MTTIINSYDNRNKSAGSPDLIKLSNADFKISMLIMFKELNIGINIFPLGIGDEAYTNCVTKT